MARNHGVKQDVFWADLAVKTLTKISGRSRVKAKELAKFPSVRRDLSLVLKEGTPFGAVRDAAMKAEKNYSNASVVRRVRSKTSSPARLVRGFLGLQDEETLNEKRIEQSVQRILDGIVQATGPASRLTPPNVAKKRRDCGTAHPARHFATGRPAFGPTASTDSTALNVSRAGKPLIRMNRR